MGAMVQGSQGARVLGAWVLAGNVVVMVAVAKLGEDGEDRERTPPQKKKEAQGGKGAPGMRPGGQWSRGRVPGASGQRAQAPGTTGGKKVPRLFFWSLRNPPRKRE